MTEFEWFITIADWEFDHIEAMPDRLDPCLWQAIAVRLMGWDGEKEA